MPSICKEGDEEQGEELMPVYKKKEIINPNRICALVSCKQPYNARRQDQKFCSHACGERDWRLAHKRVRILKKSSGTTLGTPAEGQRRDTLQTWTRYMRLNPEYAAMVTRGRPLEKVSGSMAWV